MSQSTCKHLLPQEVCADCRTRQAYRAAPPGKLGLKDTRIPFGKYQGRTLQQLADLEEVDPKTGYTTHGLSYLDWLAGQPWIYDPFKKRLMKFLANPVIARRVNDMFPEEWDDSRQPAFSSQDGYADKWHGVTMPAPEGPRDWAPPKPFWLQVGAWELAADYLFLFETADDPNAMFDVDREELRQLAKGLPKEAVQKLRDAYRGFRDRLRQSRARHFTGNAYRFNYFVTAPDGQVRYMGDLVHA